MRYDPRLYETTAGVTTKYGNVVERIHLIIFFIFCSHL